MSSDRSESTPPADLMRERDEVLQSFSRGARFTEQFAAEYNRVRGLVDELERENAQLRARIKADDALARLVEQVERLEKERQDLLRRTERAEEARGEFDARFNEVEEQFASLANLFVASNQLHSRLAPRAVVRRIKEILAQLVGAQSYTMYMLDAAGSRLVPIASEGVPGNKQSPLDARESKIGKVVHSGECLVNEERPSNQVDFEDPVAVIPLAIEEATAGAIAIFGTLEQKSKITETDFELFRLLGQHAATALISAALFEQAGSQLPGVDAFRDLSVS